MPQARLGQITRSIMLFVSGVLAATALSGNVAAAPASVSSTLTRVTSCAGFAFHPTDFQTTFERTGRMMRRSIPGGDGVYLCDPHLPNKATVTAVRFTVYDDSQVSQVRGCGLFRVGLSSSGSAANDPVNLSHMPATGIEATPKAVRTSDTSISHAQIDESAYGYWLQCVIDGGDDSTGIIGATVTYRISSTNG